MSAETTPTTSPEKIDQGLEVCFGGYSIAGLKDQNQDAFAAQQPPSLGNRHLKGVVACIADGVSCSENAQQASQTSATTFISDYYSTPSSWPVKTAAARVLAALNSWLYQQGRFSNLPHNGLVTTFSAAVIKSNTAHIFHAGDSRIYRLREGQLQQLTQDHCQYHNGGKQFLSRALGMDSRLEIDYLREDLQEDDILLLSTDGVHDYLPLRELQHMLGLQQDKLRQASCQSLESVAKHLVEQALERGSNDNLSCLLVKVESLPKQAIDEVHRQLTQLAIPPALNIGHKLDHYVIEQIIHSGSRSHVYLSRCQQDNKLYVLKIPSENFSDDAQYLEGFIREAWAGARIDHPGVMKIYPRPANSPFLYHVCEYIEGKSLRQWMYDNAEPSLEQVRDIAQKLVAALRAFQRLSMVHRDLKPENIMLDPQGQLRIIDFGTVQVDGLEEIGSLINAEVPVGSVGYTAPEYFQSSQGSHQSDIFSVGIILYEMLCGKLPYDTRTTLQGASVNLSDWKYTSALRHRSTLPLWVDLALQKASHPRLDKRCQALSELLTDLHQPNQSLQQKYRPAPLLERNPLKFWQLMSACLALIIVVQWVLLADV